MSPAPTVSVIVPVYDCKATIEECLDSLVAQTLSDLEIVVVNDGSPDSEQEIIDAYVERHPGKIVSFVKENGGLPDARNFGVAHSRGSYIGYVDSDDFVEPDMFELLLDAAQRHSCDIAIGKYIHYGLNGRTSVNGELLQGEGIVFPGYEFLLSQRSMVVWNKLYRRELVERFPQPLTWFEDVAWTPVVMTHTDRVCFVDKAFYHYVRREGSIASSHEDPRTLEGIRSIFYAIENAAPQHRDAVEFMAARRLLFESNVRPAYADRYLEALRSLTDVLADNRYLREDDYVRADTARYLGAAPIIPKRLIWPNFGAAQPTRSVPRTVESWPGNLIYSDGEITELNEQVCDVDVLDSIRKLFDAGDFELIGQYFSLVTLLAEGGVMLHPRLKANGFIAPYLTAPAFASYGIGDRLAPLAIGAVPGHRFVELLLERFTEAIQAGGSRAELLADIMNDVAAEEFGARLDGRSEQLGDLVLHSPSIFAANRSAQNVTELTFDDGEAEVVDGLAVARYSEEFVTQLRQRVIELEAREKSLRSQLRASKRKVKTMSSSARWRLVSRLRFLDSSSTVQTAARLRTIGKQRSTNEDMIRRDRYAHALEDTPIESDLALFESFYGRGMISNPYALFLAWTERSDFTSMKMVWALDDLEDHADLIRDSGSQWPNVTFVERGSDMYMSILARSKYLVNDVTFFFDFVKRPGQVYINTWHSITVKSLGFDVPGNRLDQKNVVRNMLSCDYFLAANDFVRDDMVLRSHMMRGIMPGHVLVEGHPRNDLTFRTKRSDVITEMQQLGVEIDPDKPTVVFAPTWRGKKISAPTDDVESYYQTIRAIDEALGQGSHNVLIRLHQLTHTHVRLRSELANVAIPPTVDANRMFSAIDLLVTDYSSIFFDFMVTKRPIVFYWPDLTEYSQERGLYFKPEDLPGPVAENRAELSELLSGRVAEQGIWEERYASVAEWVCPNDDGRVSERVLDVVLDDKPSEGLCGPFDTEKPRVLLFAGPLKGGRLAAKLHNVVDILGTEHFDLSVLVDDSPNAKVQWNVSKLLSRGVRVIGRSRQTTFTFAERAALAVDNHSRRTRGPKRILEPAYRREWRRCFGDASFDAVINLDQTSLFFAELLSVPTESQKYAWVDKSPVAGTEQRVNWLHQRQRDDHHMLEANADFERVREDVLSSSDLSSATGPLQSSRNSR